MRLLRTPDTRFEGLKDWPFAPHYTEVAGQDGAAIRIHHADEGPRGAPPILLMHGEPTWAYLYRHFIPPLAAAGHRVVVPDLVGFGRSDKPAERADHTYERHVDWMSQWLLKQDLTGITLFCQDWGGLIGLRLVAAFPDRFARLVIANTGLPEGAGFGPGFKNWLDFSQSVPVFPTGRIVSGGSVRELDADEVAAYDAPFPEEDWKAGPRQMPALVPVTPEHASVAENRAAWQVLERFDRPVLTAFSDQDPVTKGGETVIQRRIPGAAGQAHATIAGGGHFLQEDRPAELAAAILAFIARNPSHS